MSVSIEVNSEEKNLDQGFNKEQVNPSLPHSPPPALGH